MTGYLRLFSRPTPPEKHDHIDFIFDDGHLLRFHDPRKFGIVSWFAGDPQQQPLLAGIGPEPLTEAFNSGYLFDAARGRKVAIKQLIMNSAVVAGVGNIYANEALFRAGIRPDRASGTLTVSECSVLEGNACRAVRGGKGDLETAEVVRFEGTDHVIHFRVMWHSRRKRCDGDTICVREAGIGYISGNIVGPVVEGNNDITHHRVSLKLVSCKLDGQGCVDAMGIVPIVVIDMHEE